MQHIPPHIIEEYHLNKSKDNALVEITKGIYGLPQAGRIAQEHLIRLLNKSGYHQTPNTPCLFRHESRPIAFTLVVDDFGIKYKGIEHRDHLFAVLRSQYDITVDPTGSQYLGMTIVHDKRKHTISISLPDYVPEVIKKFGVIHKKRMTDSPLVYTPPQYGAKQQVFNHDYSPLVSHERKVRIQQIIGNLLYLARCTDPSLLTAVNKLSSKQAMATEIVEQDVDRLLQYVASWPLSVVTFHKSDMRLIAYSDASFQSESESRSRAGGVLFFGSNNEASSQLPNGPIECISVIIKSVVSSAAEAEYAAAFITAGVAEGIRHTLDDLGYPQGPTPMYTDNSCAVGIANRTVKQTRSQVIDLRFNWIQDRIAQGHFTLQWVPGLENYADFFTKALPVHKHLSLRDLFADYSQRIVPSDIMV